MAVQCLLSTGVLLLIAQTTFAAGDPIVQTPLGKASGRLLTSRSGRTYMTFSKLPYAQPPIDHLRFRPPEPIEPWPEVKDGRLDYPTCIQYNVFTRKVEGDEDCLYLSVSTHNVSRNAPVLVVFHGGAFIYGTGNWTKPTYLMDEDIVVVFVNYRLGIFGFLTFEEEELPGNQGLKDQVMSLRWVQQNIASFGGDPSRVTIYGYSAGGASVHYHYLSPLSKGLFHQGITASGSGYNPWALTPPGLARANAVRLMNLIGCPTNPRKAFPCLEKKDSVGVTGVFHKYLVFNIDPMLTFAPTLEKPGPGAFLSGPVCNWEYSPAPLVVSLCSAEGLFKVLSYGPDLKNLTSNFKELLPLALNYWASATNRDEVTMKIRDYYFPGKEEITLDSDYVNLTNMFSDSLSDHGIMEAANKAKGKVHFLYFDYVAERSIDPAVRKYTFGASHATDVAFLMEVNGPFWPKNPLRTEKDVNISKEIVKMLANYMKNGTPKLPDGSDWKTWSTDQNNYLVVDKTGFAMKEGLLEERFKFWDSLNYRDKFDVESN